MENLFDGIEFAGRAELNAEFDASDDAIMFAYFADVIADVAVRESASENPFAGFSDLAKLRQTGGVNNANGSLFDPCAFGNPAARPVVSDVLPDGRLGYVEFWQ